MDLLRSLVRVHLEVCAIGVALVVAAPAAPAQQRPQGKEGFEPVRTEVLEEEEEELDEFDWEVAPPVLLPQLPATSEEIGLNAEGVPYGTRRLDRAPYGPGGGPIDLGPIRPGIEDNGRPCIYTKTRFATNGVSLRNARRGGINLVGIPPGSAIVQVYLYWAWASLAAPVPGLHDTITIRRRFPAGAMPAATVTGTLVGTGADPCWLGASNWIFRADLTALAPTVVTAGGTYVLTLPLGAAGATDYTDPWGFPGPVAALAEGATLVVVYENGSEPMGTTCIYDAGLAGFMFLSSPGLTYTLVGYPIPGLAARWANIGADGQTGVGYADAIELGWEMTLEFNTGSPIAGGGPFGMTSPYNDSDWNGSANKPLGQLWDTSGHDVSGALIGFPTFPILFVSPGVGIADCLVPVANVLWTL